MVRIDFVSCRQDIESCDTKVQIASAFLLNKVESKKLLTVTQRLFIPITILILFL